jgi:aminoglycoside phosphotransferase (APT) family kinase protein
VIRVVHSDTKRRLSGAELRGIVRRALGAGLLEHVELTDGMFNAAYRLTTDDGRVVVLKAAPPADVPLLTYERDLMRTEALAFELMAAQDLPVPDVLHVEDGLLLMAALDGEPWWSIRDRVTPEQHSALRGLLGAFTARLHTIKGESFGYPQGPGGDAWRGAFLAMVDAVLADAARFGVALPDGLREWFQDRSGPLDEVTTPVLVHFDLWQANIFVELDPPRIVGVIDPERAFWGDPLADLVTIALFADVESDADFLAGYGIGPFTSSMRERIRLYRVYLYLIMIIEGVPRGYSGDEHERAVAFYREKLAQDLQ